MGSFIIKLRSFRDKDVSGRLTDTLEEAAELVGGFGNIQTKLDGEERQRLWTNRRHHHLVLRCITFLPTTTETPPTSAQTLSPPFCYASCRMRVDAPYWGPEHAPPPLSSAEWSSGCPPQRGSRHRRGKHWAAAGDLLLPDGRKCLKLKDSDIYLPSNCRTLTASYYRLF